jgi:hypothetical protein
MKKILIPLVIAIAGIFLCVGLLALELNKLERQINDLENGKEPDISTVKTDNNGASQPAAEKTS